MNATTDCPEIEQLFTDIETGEGPALEHAAECPVCQALLEEHRLLEKDLSRLTDPLPPPELLHKVMARVASEPVPLRREVWVGSMILTGSVLAGLGVLLASDAALGGAGRGLASLLVKGRPFLQGLIDGVSALWSTSTGAFALLASAVLLFSLLGIKRLAGNPSPSEV
jgi:hypothetical protein